jgi:DNA-binding beta-propeller fold protein YncE
MKLHPSNSIRFAELGSIALLFASPALALQQGGTPTSTTAKPAAKPAATSLHILHTYELGGEGSWDYLTIDPEGRRLYISRSTHVMVMDADTGKLAGDIPDTAGVHGIALAPDAGRGFTSNGRSASATIFDLKTLATIGTVKTGEGPDAILYDPASKRVFTFNGRSNDATAIDAAAGTVAGTIELGGKPEFAAADGAGRVFVNLEDKSEIVALDSKALKVVARWPIAPGEEPSGLAIDAKNHRLFSGCHNQMMAIVDTESGKVLATPAIGQGVDATAFDPTTACAFSSNGDGTLTVIHEDDPSTFKVLENVTTQRSAKTMALVPKTHNVYLGAAKFEAPPPEPKEGEKEGAKDAPKDGARRQRPKMVAGSFVILVVGK